MKLLSLVTVLAAVSSISASITVYRRQGPGTFTTCTIHVHGDHHVDTDTPGLEDDFHFSIGSALIAATNNGVLTRGGTGATVSDNHDDSFTIVGTIAVGGYTSTQTAAVLTSFVGTTVQGELAYWTIDTVSCVDYP